jgi:lipoyl(octanoyl) transferase
LSYSVVYKDIGLKDYKAAWDYQVEIFSELVAGKKHGRGTAASDIGTLPGTLIFVEHPHVFTLGKHGLENNLLLDYRQIQAKGASFYRIDRGGDITYHGPGQIVGYPIFDLSLMGIGLKEYVFRLEEAIIRSLAVFDLNASRYQEGTGVWLEPGSADRARKICAIGVKASRYVTMHGFALNVNTDLSFFKDINPCGFTDRGVTSLSMELGRTLDIDMVKDIVKNNLQEVFDLEWKN